MLRFYKVQATGNDFIVIDARERMDEKFGGYHIQKLCDRHFGIGADGLILLAPDHRAAYRFVYYNADGSRGAMCGNGGRAGVMMARHFGFVKKKVFCFLADDGIHQAHMLSEKSCAITLNIASVPERIALDKYASKPDVQDIFQVNSGVPHVVLILNQAPDDKTVTSIGRQIRYDERFMPAGTNVDFLWSKNGIWHVRTYERGVEAETLSCGTGIMACGLVLEKQEANPGYSFKTQGGILQVEHKNGNYWLSGDVHMVFTGNIDI